MSVETPTYDFTKSRSLDADVKNGMAKWTELFCKSSVARLTTTLGSTPELIDGGVSLHAFGDIIDDWTSPVIGCWVGFGKPPAKSLLTLNQSTARMLVNNMLGIPNEPLPADTPTAGDETPDETTELPDDANTDGEPAVQPLTNVELGLIEMLCGEICVAWMEAWPDLDAPQIQAHSITTAPEKSKFVPLKCEMHAVTLTLRVNDQSADVVWLLPTEILTEFLGSKGSKAMVSDDDRENLERLVKQVPVELVVELGEARIHLRELAKLTAGDVILLDRKLGQPLNAVIGTSSHFVGWPARIGNQQVYQIADALTAHTGMDVGEV